MQFMMIVKSSKNCEAGKTSNEELLAAVGRYTQELRKAGALVELSRLHSSSKAARVRLTKANQVVTDGPFAETKELIGGYWIIEANSLADAVEWAKRAPAPEEGCEIEIRQFLEVEDCTLIQAQAAAGQAAAQEFAKTRKQSL